MRALSDSAPVARSNCEVTNPYAERIIRVIDPRRSADPKGAHNDGDRIVQGRLALIGDVSHKPND